MALEGLTARVASAGRGLENASVHVPVPTERSPRAISHVNAGASWYFSRDRDSSQLALTRDVRRAIYLFDVWIEPLTLPFKSLIGPLSAVSHKQKMQLQNMQWLQPPFVTAQCHRHMAMKYMKRDYQAAIQESTISMGFILSRGSYPLYTICSGECQGGEQICNTRCAQEAAALLN